MTAKNVVKAVLMRLCDVCFASIGAEHDIPEWQPGFQGRLPTNLAHERFAQVLPIILAMDQAEAKTPLLGPGNMWFCHRHLQGEGVNGFKIVNLPAGAFPTINKRYVWLYYRVPELAHIIEPWLKPV